MRAAALILFLPLTVLSGESTVQDLAKAAVEAAGGLEKIPQHFAWKEEYFIGGSDKPRPRTAVLHTPTQWFQNGTNIAEGNQDRTEKTYLVWVWSLRPLLESDSKLTPLPDIQVDGKPASGLKLSREKRPDISLYFFKDTHTLARLDWRAYQVFFSAFTEKDGFKYPSQAFVKHADGKLYLRNVFKEFIRVDEKATTWPK
jgi:hypothetical protein